MYAYTSLAFFNVLGRFLTFLNIFFVGSFFHLPHKWSNLQSTQQNSTGFLEMCGENENMIEEKIVPKILKIEKKAPMIW